MIIINHLHIIMKEKNHRGHDHENHRNHKKGHNYED